MKPTDRNGAIRKCAKIAEGGVMTLSLKQNILALTTDNPDFSSRDIADIVGCLPEYVRTVWKRSAITHRSHIRHEREPRT